LEDLHISVLCVILVFLIGCSAFFSGSETGLMTLNRYRLRHRAKAGDRAALRTSQLLDRPDRLIGLILLGNNFVNVLASSLATVVALHLLGETGIVASTVAMTLITLVFGEVTPKTLAALYPERIAYPASAVLAPLLKVLYPLVWLTNLVVNNLLRLFRVRVQIAGNQQLSPEELRTVVMEAGVMIPKRHQTMLLGILELEEIAVEDIMVPRNEVAGLDLEDEWAEIVAQLKLSPYTRLLVYRGTIDQAVGFLHLRKVLNRMAQKPDFDRADLESLVREPYYIPEGTSLTQQLLNFQQRQRRVGLVVDEYGELLGLVTLEDIIEELIGKFTTGAPDAADKLTWREDGSVIVDGSQHLRNLNRRLGLDLPVDGPKTLNGLLLEHLQDIPEAGVSIKIAGIPIEVVQAEDRRIKTVRIFRTAAKKSP